MPGTGGICPDYLKSYKVKDYRAYATSAMREAHNRQIILDQIRVRTGLTVRIISNSEQRFISYKAIAAKAAEFNKIIQKDHIVDDVDYKEAQQLSLLTSDSETTSEPAPGHPSRKGAVSQDTGHCGRAQAAYRGDCGQ